MPKYLGALTIVLLLGMVLTRVFLLKRQGVKAMKFGSTDKTDFLIPPFALFYFYVLFAAAFDWASRSPDTRATFSRQSMKSLRTRGSLSAARGMSPNSDSAFVSIRRYSALVLNASLSSNSTDRVRSNA
jgi:hypothetical protein